MVRGELEELGEVVAGGEDQHWQDVTDESTLVAPVRSAKVKESLKRKTNHCVHREHDAGDREEGREKEREHPGFVAEAERWQAEHCCYAYQEQRVEDGKPNKKSSEGWVHLQPPECEE